MTQLGEAFVPIRATLAAGPAKPLKGAELNRRRREFAEMTAGVDLDQLSRQRGRSVEIDRQDVDEPET